MFSMYEITKKGKQTRDKILEVLKNEDGLSRSELCDRGLSYAQVRRQIKILICEGRVQSSTENHGKKRYFIIFTIVISMACSVPVLGSLDDDDENGSSTGDRISLFNAFNRISRSKRRVC